MTSNRVWEAGNHTPESAITESAVLSGSEHVRSPYEVGIEIGGFQTI